jgi:hypothetical protein
MVIVSTYSSVFTVSPALNDAQVIMLDDAHAAENYVATCVLDYAHEAYDASPAPRYLLSYHDDGTINVR